MNKKISYKVSLSILLILTIIAGLIIYKTLDKEEVNIPAIVFENKNSIVEENKLMATSTQSLDYLFESSPKDSKYTNIVGYFASEAFAWYVPAWIENWKMKDIKGDPDNQGMILTPREAIQNSPISDITIYVATSTENFNAETLFEKQKEVGVVMSEVLLSQHTEGGITINIEANTRIYHIQLKDRERMTDIYYIDGNNKTASISFSSDSENFLKYSAKIKELVEGIGEIRPPQG